MNIIDLFWLFFTITALQPVLRQRMLEAMRKRKMMQNERARNSRVILLIRRQETMRLLGFPLMRYIDIGLVTFGQFLPIPALGTAPSAPVRYRNLIWRPSTGFRCRAVESANVTSPESAISPLTKESSIPWA
jgi:hypothetical protein